MWSDAVPGAQLMRVAAKKAKMAGVPTEKPIAVVEALVLGAPVLWSSSSADGLVGRLDDSTAPSSSITVSCQICQPGASVAGCP